MKKCKRKKSYPDWAEYKATDANGEEVVYASKPFRHDAYASPEWVMASDTPDNRHTVVCRIYNYQKNWKKSIRKIKD